MSTQTFHIPWEPTAKGRPRFARAGTTVRTYTPEPTRHAEAAIRHLLVAAKAKRYDEGAPLRVSLRFNVARPASAPKRVRHPAKRPDLDQYVKLMLDAGNGILWPDDAQIVELWASKGFAFEGTPPSITLVVEEI